MAKAESPDVTESPTAEPAKPSPTSPSGSSSSSSPAASLSPGESVVSPPSASAVESIPKVNQVFNTVQKENLDANIPESKEDPTSIINNNSVKSYAEGKGKIPMPSVRNQEPTFQSMILFSTRVV